MNDRGPEALSRLLSLDRKKPKYTKDMQRRRVYAAENIALKDIKTAPHGQEMSLEQCQEFVDKVWSSKWKRKYFPERPHRYQDLRPSTPPRVRFIGGHGMASGGRWDISLPRWARTKMVLLHELAHSLAPVESKHDRLWARIFLMLLDRWLDPIYGKRLRVEFKARKVRYSLPKKLPPATREALRERAAAMFATYNYNVKN